MIALYLVTAAATQVTDLTPALDPTSAIVAQVVHDLTFPGMDVTWSVESCGMINAFYAPVSKHLTICTELAALGPSLVWFAASHEMGHAMIRQLNIPITGMEEMAADEVASLEMCVFQDHCDDLAIVARYFWIRGHDEDPTDDHPGDKRRGFTLIREALSDHVDLVYRWSRLIIAGA